MLSGNYLLAIPVLFPILAAIIFACIKNNNKILWKIYTIATAIITFGIVVLVCLLYEGTGILLFSIDNGLSISLNLDYVAVIYILLVSFIWMGVVTYSHGYIESNPREKSYYSFTLGLLGVLIGLGMAGNLVSFYVFYELMTFLCFPLICYSGEEQDIEAAITFIIYSIFGATLALAGICLISANFGITEFIPGGLLLSANYAITSGTFIASVLMIFFGFGTKAGIFPLQTWLPIAHPAAPAAISAPLSGLITKAGVLGILRYTYYVIGTTALFNTWIQKLWLGFTLLTVFIGSMMAYKEPILKKRLAYSSISQISYVLFGLGLLDEAALKGSLMQLVYHGLAKSILFLCVGAIIHETGKTSVSELRGIGKEMETVMLCFTVASLSLIGIPPMGGFISKWYLISGALESNTGFFRYLGPGILLVSSLLTAGYLLPIVIKAFFPGEDYDYAARVKHIPSKFITIAIVALTIALIVFSVYPSLLSTYIDNILFAIFAGV